MAVVSRSITATTTPQEIVIADLLTDRQAGCTLWIHNNQNNTSHDVYIGGSDLSQANGFHIPPDATFGPITLQHQESLWIVASDTSNVRILITGA